MALIVEDGTGLSTAESYLSVADADTYFSNRGITTWTGADSVKEAALRKATQYLDSTYSWAGTGIVQLTQSLSLPRYLLFDKEGRDLSETIPTKVEEATAELALAALSEELVPTRSNSDFIKREKVGSLEVEYRDNSPESRQYPLVDRLLSGLYVSKVSTYGNKTVLR